jgi:hypothetical protein
MPRSNYKVSSAGWLCFEEANGNWIPLFKLTTEQLREWNEFHKKVR